MKAGLAVSSERAFLFLWRIQTTSSESLQFVFRFAQGFVLDYRYLLQSNLLVVTSLF